MPRSLSELQSLVDQLNKDGKGEHAHIGTYIRSADPIPTGILALDVILGGGFPRGCAIGIYGPKDIGKSALALYGLANAQRMDLGCAYIAYEQKWHPEWVKKFGVDPEQVIVTRPDTIEKAFDQLFKLLSSPVIDFVVFDSLGATLAESEVYGTDTKDAKAKVGGQSAQITHGMKRIPYQLWKGQKTALMLNHVRQNMAYGGYYQPGGEALEHLEEVIIELKNGGDRFEMKDSAGKKTDVIQYGQEVAAVIKRSQRTEGSKVTARYDFYQKPGFNDHPVGVDQVKDMINTAKRVGAFDFNGSWFVVPGIDKKFQAGEFAAYLSENPKEEKRVRKLVLENVG
jgi:recombination protein RecA